MRLFSPRSKGRSTADVSTAEQTGWLHKEGETNRDFRRRFFVLNGASLAYFKEEEDVARGESKGELTVAAVSHLHATSKEAASIDSSNLPRCFAVDASSGRRYILLAETVEQKVEWIRALGAAIGRPVHARPRLEEYMCERIGGSESSEAVAAGASEGPPSDGWVAIAEGLRHVQAGHAVAAQISFDRAIALAGGTDREPACEACARFGLGKCLVARGEHSAAAHHFESALALAPLHTAGGAQQLKLQLAWCLGHLPARAAESSRLYSEILDEDLFCGAAFLDRGKFAIRAVGAPAPL